MTQREAASVETAPAPAGVTPERVAPRTLEPLPEDVNPVGVYMTPKHAYYLNGDGPVPSVTTVLEIIDKPGIGVFKAKEAARAVYQVDRVTPRVADLTEEDAIKWALKEADKARDAAGDLGSAVHLLADLVGNAPQGQETVSTGFGVDESTYPYIEAYRGFLDRYSASSIVSSEHAVWSLKGYAGTYDFLMNIRCGKCGHCLLGTECFSPELWLIDIKTSGKGPYPEWGLQLAGYRWADYIVLPGDPTLYPMPEIQRAGVLHLRPDLYPDTGWRLIEYPITKALDYTAFLSALDLWRWRNSKRFTKSRLLGATPKE